MVITKRVYDILLRDYVTGKAKKKYVMQSLECACYYESSSYIYFKTYMKVSVIIDKASRVAYDLTPILYGEEYSMSKVRFNTEKFISKFAKQFTFVEKIERIQWEA